MAIALPLTAVELIEMLDSQFPPVKPRPGMTQDEIMYQAGARSVVDALLGRAGVQPKGQLPKIL